MEEEEVCSGSDGKYSDLTKETFTAAVSKTSSSLISQPSSWKSLWRNLETPAWAASTCFTGFAVLPWKSCVSSTVSVSPEAKKHTSMAICIRIGDYAVSYHYFIVFY